MTEEQRQESVSVPDVEMDIAKDIAKWSPLLIIPAAAILGAIRGIDATWAVVLAGLIILANLFIAAEISRICARISPSAMMVGALSGFVVRLIIVFAAALIVRNIDAIDFKVWLLSVAIGHIALLAWETRRVSFSLAHPGVTPRKNG